MLLLAPIKTLNRRLYFGLRQSRTGFFPGLSYHCRLLPYRVTGHRPLATGHYPPPCDHRATGKDGSLSTTSVNRRGPPSMPRAELGNHCLNRWPVKWKRGVHAAFKVAKRCASDGHCHPTFRHFHAAIQEALGAMSTKHLRQPASLTTRILQQFDDVNSLPRKV